MAQNPDTSEPPRITTENSNKIFSTGSPHQQRPVTFGSTPDKSTSTKNLTNSDTQDPEPSLRNLQYIQIAKFTKDNINQDLWKIAFCIWDFLPVCVVTSLSGDILYCFHSEKQYTDYSELSTLIVLIVI